MYFRERLNLRAADRIVTPWLESGITKHHAIYLGFNHVGQELIAENDINYGVRLITADQFFKDHPVISRIEPFVGNETARKSAVETAIALQGQQYNLLKYNCEHYANHVQNGVVESPQVKNFLAGLGLVALLVAIVKS